MLLWCAGESRLGGAGYGFDRFCFEVQHWNRLRVVSSFTEHTLQPLSIKKATMFRTLNSFIWLSISQAKHIVIVVAEYSARARKWFFSLGDGHFSCARLLSTWFEFSFETINGRGFRSKLVVRVDRIIKKKTGGCIIQGVP